MRAHLGEGIDAAVPSLVEIVAADKIDLVVAQGTVADGCGCQALGARALGSIFGPPNLKLET
jgi:hypothetical protein